MYAFFCVKAWFKCPIGAKAPNQELHFVKGIIAYREIDIKLSEAMLNKICNHFWYLTEEALGFAFFDETIYLETKRKMVRSLYSEGITKNCKRIVASPSRILSSYGSKTLDEFVTKNTTNFFHRFSISTDFLFCDPSQQPTREDYKFGSQLAYNLHVVNDAAEQGVRFIKEYNRSLTVDEDRK